MMIRPLRDRLVAKRVDEETTTAAGLIIPETAKEKPSRAKVIAAGKGRVLENGEVRSLDVKPGDTVLVGKYAGTEVQIDGEDHLILREDEVLGVVG